VPRELKRDVPLEIPENPKPPGSTEDVVVVVQLEVVVGRHCMVDPPKSGGDEIGEEDVYRIVTSSYHQ